MIAELEAAIRAAADEHSIQLTRRTELGFRSIHGPELDHAFQVISAAAHAAVHNHVEKNMQNDSKALAINSNQPTGELAELGSMSVQTIVDRKRKIATVLKEVMVEGEHYGLIPGCGDKPSLFKAGAEVLATTFGLSPTFKITRTDLPGGHREYEIVCTLHHIQTGAVLGEGVGVCSTLESKYRWRNASRKCPDCHKDTIIKGKEEYGGGWICFARKGGCGHKWPNGAAEIEKQEVGRVENPDIADTYNTVLKIAKKRAQVDCTLTSVGASDILTQDLEDLAPANDQEPRRTEQQREPAQADAKKAEQSTSASSFGKSSKAKPVPEMTEDEIVDLIEQMSRCGTEKALNKLTAPSRERVFAQPDPIRHRILRAYENQLEDIKAAIENERRAS